MLISRRQLVVGAVAATSMGVIAETGSGRQRDSRRANSESQGLVINPYQNADKALKGVPKFEVVYDYRKHQPSESSASPEEGGTLRYNDRVLVGVAIRCNEGDTDALVVRWAKTERTRWSAKRL